MNPAPPHRSRGRAEPPTLRELRAHPAVRHYLLFCLTALFLMVVCLADRGLEWWCAAPALIGCLTLLAHWSQGPPLVILSLVGLLGLPRPRSPWSNAGWLRYQTPTLMDLLLCISVLAYVIGHYRLLAMTRSVFPPDSRRPREGTDADPTQRRSADLVTGWELALLGLALPVWTTLSVMLWAWMTEDAPPLGMAREGWRILRLVWLVLGVLAAAGIVSTYRRWATATPRESLLYLQDEVWRQTRREQTIINRWLTWARLRAQRKKEKP
jgi:hypothetical protein